MLISLHVKNLALIDEAEVEFGRGLNILTGETGAGKSIIIGSINLALGGKADKDSIRTGADQAVIELVFQLEDEQQKRRLAEMELPVEEDGVVILQRRITASRSTCRVCGETVTARQLKELAELLIHIHGQRDNQTLLEPRKQMEYLDRYAGEAAQQLLAEVRNAYHVYTAAKQEYQKTTEGEAAGKRELSLAEFEVEEITGTALKPGEDEQLEMQYRRMVNGRRIMECIQKVYVLTGYEDPSSAGNSIGAALHELKTAAALDLEAAGLEEQMISLDGLLNDFNRDLSEYISNMEFDEEEFSQVEQRLDEINHLKSKYGDSYEEIMAYLEQQQSYLEKMSDYEAYKAKTAAAYEAAQEKLRKLCGRLSQLRKKTGKQLAEDLTGELKDLNFLEVRVAVQVEPQEEKYSADGYDQVCFMISMNPGEPLRELSNVASGGELSRIMLACMTLMADKDEIATVIFDEIDAGISGRTAWKVSEKLGRLSKRFQVICITHLPQIAAMADAHFVIEKTSDKQITRTGIRRMEDNEVIQELSRMLGGELITDAVRQNAVEMKTLAEKSKENCS